MTHTFGNAMLIYCTIALIYLGVVYAGLWILRRWENALRVPGFETDLTYRNLEVFSIVAMIYLSTIVIFSRILGMIERKVRIPGLGGKGA